MVKLGNQLEIARCPFCKIDKPNLSLMWETKTNAHSGGNDRWWKIYLCANCGGLVTAAANNNTLYATEIYPLGTDIDDAIPQKAKKYLEQAVNSLHAPDGAIMLAASSIDAMLKDKGYTDGSLNHRIDSAAKDHLITDDMAKWAHQVRLDANDQRHSDQETQNASTNEATRATEFALALAEFLFVLPSKVTRGLKETNPQTK